MRSRLGRIVQMRRWFVVLAALLLVALPSMPVQGASPFDGPPGLERAIAAQDRHEDALLAVPGVAGVGVGLGGDGRAAVIVFTETAGVRGLPASLDGVAVVPQVSGKFTVLPRPGPGSSSMDPTGRFERPVPIGVSTGHPDITAGTIGARVKDASGNVYALSNNHVYANQNLATIGDAVIQPGTYDGGVSPADDIGTLAAFVPIVFGGGDNMVDAAIALSSLTNLGNATPSNGYGRPKSTIAVASLNMKVKKYGRTTGLTKGQVYAIHVTVNVGYGPGKVARFVDQIVINPGTFSAGGDSGSLIVVDAKRSASDRRPVGLLFAGSSMFTIANPIDAVLAAFNVIIDGQ